MKSADIREKIKKNVIVHHYEYNALSQELINEIEERERQLLDLKRKLNAKISIYLPEEHTIFSTGLHLTRKELEWSTHTVINGEERQRRELIYIEAITDNADMTAILDNKAKFAIDFSDENYKKLEGIHYGKRSILKLSGYDIKDISGKD